MKTRNWLPLLCSAILAQPAAATFGPPVLETAEEFFVSGNFIGDGSLDYLVIDRASGGMRIAEARSAGNLIMRDTHATGIPGLSAVAVGRFTLTDRDAVAVTSPEANRVRIAGPSGILYDAWPPGVGPRHITGLPLPGGAPGRDDLVALTVLNAPGKFGPTRRGFLLNDTTPGFSTWKTQFPAVEPQSPLAVAMSDGGATNYAELREDGGTLLFTIFDVEDPDISALTQCSGIEPDSRVVYGNFNPSHARSVFVFHVPGSDTVQVSTVDRFMTLGTPLSHPLSAKADWLQPFQAGTRPGLAAISSGGGSLQIYLFDNSSTPILTQTVSAPDGQIWSGLVPAADGGWFAASAPPGGPSAGLQRFHHTGGKTPFTAGATYNLEPLHPEELGSDILLFNGKPFTDNNPILRGRYRVGGWSSQLNDDPSFPSDLQVMSESWRGASLGLGLPVSNYLGFRPVGVTHGLSNQIAPDASFYSLDAPIGDLADQLEFDPPAGMQTLGIEVSLLVDNPTSLIYYRTSSTSPWLSYSSPIGPISSETTIHAYAQTDGVKTPIQSATYTFPSYPGDIDSDSDGVPDFVETHHGLDPLTSGLDQDRDGVSDLQEILAGTDPTDPLDKPDSATIRSLTRHFDISVEPRSHSGVAYGEALDLVPSLDGRRTGTPGTWININRPDGTLELDGAARAVLLNGPVLLSDSQRIVPSPPLFWVAGTPNRFMIEVAGKQDPLRGRGVFRLLDYTAPDLDPLPQPELNGSTAEQVSQWVTAARDHLHANARVEVGGIVSFTETVDLLLAERALGLIFHARGWTSTAKVSLTPFRGDARRFRIPPGFNQPDRYPVNDTWLTELPSAAYGDDGYDWAELLEFIRDGRIPKGPTRENLDELAREIYRIGYHAYDDPDNPINVAPFDALRELIDSGALPTDYTKALATPGTVLQSALEFLKAFDGALPERAHTGSPLLLVAEIGFFQDPWLILREQSSRTSYWLADDQGRPLGEPAGFRILPGYRFLATGHTSDREGGGKLLKLGSITLLDAPMPGTSDSDHNLLADDWEAFYYGTLGNDAFSDSDADRYMLLQEMFENTDPRYGPDFPTAQVVDLRPPHPELQPLGNQRFDLTWRWPALYHDRVRFSVEGNARLQDFELLLDNITATSGDLFETTVDSEGHDTYFFRVRLKLR